MKAKLVFALASFTLLYSCVMANGEAEPKAAPPNNWPSWRGPQGTGVVDGADPPVEWSETKNVKWKAKLPGLGHSSPVVWGDHVYLTTAVPIGDRLKPTYSKAPGAHDNLPITSRQQFVVLCVSLADGSVLWKKAVKEVLPHEGGHFTSSHASASPVTDGKVVIAHFGSHGTYCFSKDGELLWEKQLGRMDTKHGHGEGSSPTLHGDTVVVNWDHEGSSFIIALDAKSGDERWRVKRDEVTSWTSPIVVEYGGRTQVIVGGTTRVRGYDINDGKFIWECGGLSGNVVATPIAYDGMLFVGSSYEIRSMLAIKLDGAEGDITGTKQVVWIRRTGTPYVPSPILYGESLYFLRHYQGILTKVVAKSGVEETGPFRLRLRDIYASPVGAGKRIYITDLDGVTQVITHGKITRPLALNRLDDSFSATPAIVGNKLLLRGKRHLYCLEQTE